MLHLILSMPYGPKAVGGIMLNEHGHTGEPWKEMRILVVLLGKAYVPLLFSGIYWTALLDWFPALICNNHNNLHSSLNSWRSGYLWDGGSWNDRVYFLVYFCPFSFQWNSTHDSAHYCLLAVYEERDVQQNKTFLTLIIYFFSTAQCLLYHSLVNGFLVI